MYLLVEPPGHGEGMIETVKSLLFRGDGAGIIHECRRCGTTVDADCTTCPDCGSDDIAHIATQ